ncbi:protein phosphatase 2C domain-containing protein [Streptomyces sp. UNOC14_S4]|uniref:protein phosphatase 2C domain-containing protein n=1 Tax=Streptomyces sp. UNOC14_S4 TaxID=2872340 RepID=UPI001E30F3D3|nr:protein phosphatase 2C domain-containing protein [Streptomyces sp. UNOC14_S4]MCC3772533.1 protein phosphatase 2C domain-containing protein [Streptomyces sp. UNOC14_S4]
MRIELATLPGDNRHPNEDFVSVALPAAGRGGALVLLDGVTPPPSGETGCAHGVPWFTARLGGALLELAVARPDLSLADCLGEAVSRTADAHRDTCDLTHRRTPQATVVLARWDDERVSHLVLSDSALLLESPDGTVSPVLDDRIARLAALGPVTDAQRNAEGGFFTAAADPHVTRRAVTGTRPRASVRSLSALTDGAARWVEVFGEGDWAACHTLLSKEGPEALIASVRALENRAELRGKRHDDAAAAYVAL